MPVTPYRPTPPVAVSNRVALAPGREEIALSGTWVDPDQLSQRPVRPGDGRRRSSVLTHRERAKAWFRTAGLTLAGVVLGVPLAVPVLLFEGAVRLAGIMRRARSGAGGNEAAAIGTADPLKSGMLALMKEPGGGLDTNQAVMAALHGHAQKMKSPLSSSEITRLVRAGQHLVLALRDPAATPADEGSVMIDGTSVRCNAWLARALSWYLMAVAAAQDVAAASSSVPDGADMETPEAPPVFSDLLTNGSMVMSDPDQRLYRFLRGAVLAAPRPSTHFASKSASGERFKWLGIFPSASPQQFGIEDMLGRFPGNGGALLFDSLQEHAGGPTQLFVKFGKAGYPPLSLREDASGSRRIAYSMAAVHRNIGHALNFISTRFEPKHDVYHVERLEHVHKGRLKGLLYEPFVALVEDAVRSGLIAPEYKSILKGVETHGLPFLAATVDAIHDIAKSAAGRLGTGKSKGAARHLDAARAMRSAQQLATRFHEVMKQFGETLPGVERKGAEVHLDLDTALRYVDWTREPTVDRSRKAPPPWAEPAPQWHPVRTGASME